MKISTYNFSPFFEKNIGQYLKEAKYKVKANDYITFFTDDKLIVSLPSNIENTKNIFAMKLENINSDIKIQGEEKLLGEVNYFKGNEQSKWITNIPTYSKIKYEEIYDNIDLYYYINDGKLEYDFIITKEAKPEVISISFEGIDNIEIDHGGSIVLAIGDVRAKLLKPQVYQVIDNNKIYVDCEYKIDENNLVSFLIGQYEKEYELVLDPVLTLDYSTYVASSKDERLKGMALDSSGCIYITGITSSDDYPTTFGAYQTTFKGFEDAFVTKLSKDGCSLIYSTYLGGTSGDNGYGVAVDGSGNAYITGSTLSRDFPTTSEAYQTTFPEASCVFVTKLSKEGSSLVYSTYIGGSGGQQEGDGIAVDNSGNAYITGYTSSSSYPTTSGAYQTTNRGNGDSFVTKLAPDGKSLAYSTYIGGTGIDSAYAIAIDSSGYAYITGATSSTNYPVTSAYQSTSKGGGSEAFVTKVATDGKSLVYSTYLGGSGSDKATAIAVDSAGYAYITGYTTSTNYPVTSSSYQSTKKGANDAFVTKLATDGRSLIYSTYLGGTGGENGNGIAVDSLGWAYVTGTTSSNDFPTTTNAYQHTLKGSDDVFVTKFSADGSKLLYSTLLGGSGGDMGLCVKVDATGDAYLAGSTISSDFPTTQDAYQPSFQGVVGYNDMFVSKLTFVEFDLTYSCYPDSVKLFDEINTSLNIENVSNMDLDMKIIYQIDKSSVEFVENSLYIQNINQSSDDIPSSIYINKFPAQESANVRLNLKYIRDIFPNNIPIVVTVELYDSSVTTPSLVYTTTKTFYISTEIGVNYISGCNQNLYNLEIGGKLQTTLSGMPIIYYKSGASYIYIEPNTTKYEYKKLENPTNVIEHLILNTPKAYETSSQINDDKYVSETSYLSYIDLTYSCTPNKVKLLGNANTSLILKNISTTNLDVKIEYKLNTNSVEFVPNSMYIQNIRQYSSSILSPIYLKGLLAGESIEVSMDFIYATKYSQQNIPFATATIYIYNSASTLLYSNSINLYINTQSGSNYIPGCNKNLYTLEIDGKIQTTSDGMPIIYYKSGTSYIYREPNTSSYVYKVLSSQGNIVEYLIQKP